MRRRGRHISYFVTVQRGFYTTRQNILTFSPVFCNAKYRGETEETVVSEGLERLHGIFWQCFFNPSVTSCHLPYIFALQKHPVILRDTAREEYEILVDGIGRELIKLYKNERDANFLLPFRVIELGFEPKTHSLEGCCSIQLSYSTDLLWKSAAKLGIFRDIPNICILFFVALI